MKKSGTILLSLIATILAVPCFAQDAILDKIEQRNTALNTIQAHFDQTKTLQSGKEIQSSGTLYFSAPDRMSMIYDVPAGDLFLIDGKSLYMNHGKSKQHFDTEKNALMGSLSSTLLNCVRGQVRDLAGKNNATVSVSESSAGITVTLDAQKKSTRGYSRIVLLYDKSTSILIRMDLVEFTKITTTYIMTSIRTDLSLDPAVFSAP